MSKVCKQCGSELEDNALFCDECGARVEIENKQEEINVQVTTQATENQNIGVAQQKVNDSVVKQPTQSQNETKKQSGLGIVGFIFGILSFLSCGVFYIPEILGIVFCCVALSDKTKKHGLAVAGLILSIVGALICVALLIYGLTMQ